MSKVAKLAKFVDRTVSDYCIKSRAEINRQHTHVFLLLFKVCKGCGEVNYKGYILDRSVCSVCKLVSVAIGGWGLGGDVTDVCHYQSLKAIRDYLVVIPALHC